MESAYKIFDRVESHGLLAARFVGVFSFDALQPLIAELEQFERRYPQGFNRFTDLSTLQGITISTADLHRIAEERRNHYHGPAVKSAVYTSDPLAFGMCRIYAAVVYPFQVSVGVFYKVNECAEFLELDEALLKTG